MKQIVELNEQLGRYENEYAWHLYITGNYIVLQKQHLPKSLVQLVFSTFLYGERGQATKSGWMLIFRFAELKTIRYAAKEKKGRSYCGDLLRIWEGKNALIAQNFTEQKTRTRRSRGNTNGNVTTTVGGKIFRFSCTITEKKNPKKNRFEFKSTI